MHVVGIHDYLSLLGLLCQLTTDWVAYKQQEFISHSFKG